MTDLTDVPGASVSENHFPMTQACEERSRTSVIDCPDEILLKIAKTLCSKRDYYNLCLVKPFKRVTTELLYHSPYRYNMTTLLRTVLQSPERAALIRNLGICSSSCKDVSVPSEHELNFFEDRIRALDLYSDDEERWIEGLNNDESIYGVMSALLLLNVPKITEFSTDQNICWEPFVKGDEDTAPAHFGTPVYWAVAFPQTGYTLTVPPPPRFENLKSITIREERLDLPQIAPLFHLEALQELTVWEASETTSRSQCDWDLSIFPNGTSSITTLRLGWCHIHISVLAIILRSCRALEHFTYSNSDFGGTGLRYGSGPVKTVDFSPVRKALLRFIHSLRSLIIYSVGLRYSDAWKPIGSLTDFEQLESLKVDFAVLFLSGSSGAMLSTFLPRSIQRFRMRDTNWRFLENMTHKDGLLSDLPGNTMTVLPHLRYVALGGSFYAIDHTIQYEDKRLLLELDRREFKSHQFMQEREEDNYWGFDNDSDDESDDEPNHDLEDDFETSDDGSDDSDGQGELRSHQSIQHREENNYWGSDNDSDTDSDYDSEDDSETSDDGSNGSDGSENSDESDDGSHD